MTWNAKYGLSKFPRNSFVGGTKQHLFGNGTLQHTIDCYPSTDSSNSDEVPIVIPLSINNANCTTWPKMKKAASTKPEGMERLVPRPRTATLERPRILDIAFLGKIDMSLTRKGFISISNLCLSPVQRAESKDAKRVCSSIRDGRGNKLRKNRMIRKQTAEENNCKESRLSDREGDDYMYSSSIKDKPKITCRKSPPVLTQVQRDKPSPKHSRQDPLSSNSDEMNNNVSKCHRPVVFRKGTAEKKVDEVFVSSKPVLDVPEPCTTCGRPEQPERFHSHPTTAIGASRSSQRVAVSSRVTSRSPRGCSESGTLPTKNDNPPVKSSVRKPVPIKFRSGKNSRPPPAGTPSSLAVSPELTEPTPMAMSPLPRKDVNEKLQQAPRPRGGPRIVMCYLCGREFGTASYPLHEPHCLQRWQRENCQLPVHLQRPLPQKPEKVMSLDEWNQFAWEASQARLVPCDHCGRTFNPERLSVHQRSCRGASLPVATPGNQQMAIARRAVTAVPTVAPTLLVTPAQARKPPDGAKRELGGGGGCGSGSGGNDPTVGGGHGSTRMPPTVPCYVCGRMFGSASIGIHEPKCLEKWRAENNRLPAQQRRPDPVKPEAARTGQYGGYVQSHHHMDAAHTSIATDSTAAAAVAVAAAAAVAAATAVAQPPALSCPSSACSIKRPWKRAVPCYLCGRLFGTASINIHEGQCLKKWRLENDKLPSHKRRDEPEKPAIMYSASGDIDYEGTMDAIWQTHLEQLVPCNSCGRTFYPDRIEVHERACKGPKR